MTKELMVNECYFPVYQGEGANSGRPRIFLRTQLCGVGCSWCLGPNVKVNMVRGPEKRIKDVVVGDELISWDEATGQFCTTTVVATKTHTAKKLWSIEYSKTPGAGGNSIVCTPEHLFYVKNRGWTQAENIQSGDVLLDSGAMDFVKWRMRNYNPAFDPEVAVRMRATAKKNMTPERRDIHRRRMLSRSHILSAAMLGDKNPMKRPDVHAKNVANHTYTTSGPEKRVIRIAAEQGLPVEHCNMKVRIGRWYPDFIIPGTKKVIEVYDPSMVPMGYTKTREELGYAQERVDGYAKMGYQCLPLIVKAGVTEKQIITSLTEFIMNSAYIIKSQELRVSGQGGKPGGWGGTRDVVDITCEPHPVFFANSLLTHNCDSSYTWDYRPQNAWSDEKILSEVKKAAPLRHISFTGGEPFQQGEAVKRVTEMLLDEGFTIEFETSATQVPPWKVAPYKNVQFNVSPKPPSAQAKIPTSAKAMEWFICNSDVVNWKFVCNGQEDLDWIVGFVREWSLNEEDVYVMPQGIERKEVESGLKWLWENLPKHLPNANISDRLHVRLFGAQRRI